MEYVNEVVEKDTVRQAFDNEKKHRWLSMDPVLKANESPYAGFANNPLLYVDPDGRDTFRVHMQQVKSPLPDKGVLFLMTFSLVQRDTETTIHLPLTSIGENEFYLSTNRKSWIKPNDLSEKRIWNISWTERENDDRDRAIFLRLGNTRQLIHRGTFEWHGSGCLIPGFYPRLDFYNGKPTMRMSSGTAAATEKHDYNYSEEIIELMYTEYEKYKSPNSTEGDFGFQLVTNSVAVTELKPFPAEPLPVKQPELKIVGGE